MFENLPDGPARPHPRAHRCVQEGPEPQQDQPRRRRLPGRGGQDADARVREAAEAKLLRQGAPKTYLPIEGSPEYGALVRALLFGAEPTLVSDGRAVTAQTPGGTGALRVAGDLAKAKLGTKRVLGERPDLGQSPGNLPGRRPRAGNYAYYDAATQRPRLRRAAGDARARPGRRMWCCCTPAATTRPASTRRRSSGKQHRRRWPRSRASCRWSTSPTRASPTASTRTRCRCALFAERGLELLVCSSFSKNFGLYNERVGALTLVGARARTRPTRRSASSRSAIRTNYSNPPSHGGAVVSDGARRSGARGAVAARSGRHARPHQRHAHAVRGDAEAEGREAGLRFITHQKGMFSFSGLSPEQVDRLKDKHAHLRRALGPHQRRRHDRVQHGPPVHRHRRGALSARERACARPPGAPPARPSGHLTGQGSLSNLRAPRALARGQSLRGRPMRDKIRLISTRRHRLRVLHDQEQAHDAGEDAHQEVRPARQEARGVHRRQDLQGLSAPAPREPRGAPRRLRSAQQWLPTGRSRGSRRGFGFAPRPGRPRRSEWVP